MEHVSGRQQNHGRTNLMNGEEVKLNTITPGDRHKLGSMGSTSSEPEVRTTAKTKTAWTRGNQK